MSEQILGLAAEKPPYGAAKAWTQYMSDIFTTRSPPSLGTVLVDELEAMAKEKLKGYPRECSPAFSSHDG